MSTLYRGMDRHDFQIIIIGIALIVAGVVSYNFMNCEYRALNDKNAHGKEVSHTQIFPDSGIKIMPPYHALERNSDKNLKAGRYSEEIFPPGDSSK